MQFETEWLLEGRILLTRMRGEVTEEELLKIDRQMIELLEAASGERVHIIADDRNAPNLPLNLMRKMQSVRHPKIYWFVSIKSQNSIVPFILSVGAQLFNIRVHSKDSMEEALAFLQEMDETLPDLSHIQPKLVY